MIRHMFLFKFIIAKFRKLFTLHVIVPVILTLVFDQPTCQTGQQQKQQPFHVNRHCRPQWQITTSSALSADV